MLILEHLRQVAARLWQWILAPGHAHSGSQGAGQNDLVARRVLIQRFVQLHHTEQITLADLAEELDLSLGRTSHVVRASCGTTFKDLLIRTRLHTAMGRLRHSTLSVLEVAMRSGFQEVAHFHRLFRRRIGTTPRRYRQTAQS